MLTPPCLPELHRQVAQRTQPMAGAGSGAAQGGVGGAAGAAEEAPRRHAGEAAVAAASPGCRVPADAAAERADSSVRPSPTHARLSSAAPAHRRCALATAPPPLTAPAIIAAGPCCTPCPALRSTHHAAACDSSCTHHSPNPPLCIACTAQQPPLAYAYRSPLLPPLQSWRRPTRPSRLTPSALPRTPRRCSSWWTSSTSWRRSTRSCRCVCVGGGSGCALCWPCAGLAAASWWPGSKLRAARVVCGVSCMHSSVLAVAGCKLLAWSPVALILLLDAWPAAG